MPAFSGIEVTVPGLALVLQERYDPTRFERCLRRMVRVGYAAKTLHDDGQHFALGYACYPDYPVRLVEGLHGIGLIEGALVGLSQSTAQTVVQSFLEALARDPEAARTKLEAFCRQADGDFVITLFDPLRLRVLVANDLLGRLQLFYRQHTSDFMIAREMKFLTGWLDVVSVERQALAETLLFGYPLGNTTHHSDIRRVPVASSIYLDCRHGVIDIRPYHTWNFEDGKALTVSRSQKAAQLAEQFVECCRRQANWADGRPLVVSLSGGLDSRSVVAGYSAANVSYSTASFIDSRDEATADIRIAEQIAHVLGVRWELYRLAKPRFSDAAELVDIRDGLNYIGVAPMLEFLAHLLRSYGREACVVTGDMGQYPFTNLKSAPSMRTAQDFVNYRLTNTVWPLDLAARLVKLKPREVKTHLIDYFSGYPEKSVRNWNVHFTLMERMLRLSLEGEERNRSIMWSMAPLGSPSFFAELASIPEEQKSHHILYGEFLRNLNPTIAEIPYAQWNARIGSRKARVRTYAMAMFAGLPRFVKEGIKHLVLPSRRDFRALQGFERQFDSVMSLELVQDIVEVDEVRRIVGKLNRVQFQELMTLMMYLAKVSGYDLNSLV
jgi:asparagine synthase (glutamine-hydrolysing)